MIFAGRAQPHEPAGISSDHAERALGHVIAGVRGVYDQHNI